MPLKRLDDDIGEYINWPKPGGFKYPGMFRKGQPQDGSCYFHAICDAYFERYQKSDDDEQYRLIVSLRRDLSKSLPKWYPTLSRGTLAETSQFRPDCTLQQMIEELACPKSPINLDIYQEYISNCLNRDVYIIDARQQDVVVLCRDDDDILYKNRESIVLLLLHGHYELIGCVEADGPRTLFSPQSPFIRAINERKQYLWASRIKT